MVAFAFEQKPFASDVPLYFGSEPMGKPRVIVDVNPVEGVFSLMEDEVRGFMHTHLNFFYQTDKAVLEKAQQGAFLWVVWPQGSELFCQSLLSSREKTLFACKWLKAVASQPEAKSFYGQMLPDGGYLTQITTDAAIKKMAQWIFDSAE